MSADDRHERRKPFPEVADRPLGRTAAHAGRSNRSPPAPRPCAARRRHCLVGRRLCSPGFRRRHPRLQGPVAAGGLGLLERPVFLAEHDIVADRRASISVGTGRRPALAVSGTIGAAAASWFRARLDEAHLAAGDIVLLSSPGGDLNQAIIMGEIIRSRGLVTAVGVADASGHVGRVLLRQRLRARLCRRQDRAMASRARCWGSTGS